MAASHSLRLCGIDRRAKSLQGSHYVMCQTQRGHGVRCQTIDCGIFQLRGMATATQSSYLSIRFLFDLCLQLGSIVFTAEVKRHVKHHQKPKAWVPVAKIDNSSWRYCMENQSARTSQSVDEKKD
jgi:hypothetical protein